MNLLKNILAWTEELPLWQRDACRRLLQSEVELSENDFAELYDLLKIEHGIQVSKKLNPIPLASTHLPASIQSGETVTFKELRELNHVNRIAPNQTLSFNETGMSVIYGGNGTGKSGYVRVMKQACRCRDQSDTVHTNANNPSSSTFIPEAKFKIELLGKEEVMNWSMSGISPEVLSSISVFDAHCARSYLTAENDIAYLPYGLDIVEDLARNIIPELQLRLNAEISSIDTSTMAFEHLLGSTEVGIQVSKLSEKTDTKIIEKLASLSVDEVKRVDELNKALAVDDPIVKAEELKRLVSRLKNLADNINRITLWVNDDAVRKLIKLDEDLVAAEDAEKIAAQSLQAGESLLPGTGEQLWKTLFEAARNYSTQAAFPKHEFPHLSEGSICVFCQTPLDEKTGKRLERFEQYIKDDVAKQAEEKRKNMKDTRQKIDTANLKIDIDKNLKEEIFLHNEDIVNYIVNYQGSILEKRLWMLGALDTHKWDKVVPLADNPKLLLRNLAAQKLREARTFIKAADVETKKTLVKEQNELVSRQNLNKSLKTVLTHINRKKKVACLSSCNKDLKTKSISNKSKEFASEAVTKELKNALDAEFSNLNVGHIKTKLKEKNVKGKMHHQLLLELPTSRVLSEILSEGEQSAIALGSFLAELSLANHSCGIVFDDPVSSLDHLRRKHVAQRLAKEAKKRQVIIFTHDTSFLVQLRDEIQINNLPHKIQYLEWKGNYAGNVYDGLPWGHSSYKERIDALEKDYRKLVNKPWPQYPGEEETSEMMSVYSRMRATIERVIQDVVFLGVIRRYRDWINIKNLKDVVGFEDSECDEIMRLYQRCNNLVEAHDPASDKNQSIPSLDELAKDIDDLKQVIQDIKQRRKAKSTTIL